MSCEATKDEQEPTPEVTDAQASFLEAVSKDSQANQSIAEATDSLCNPIEEDYKVKGELEDLMLKVSKAGKWTLSLAIHSHETFEACQHHVWLLLCHLRMGTQGCDSDVLPNPFHCRTKAATQGISKWHNMVRHQVAVQEAQDRQPTTRTSRQAAWVESCEALRNKMSPNLPSTLVVKSGQIMACFVNGSWQVGMVLSIWRFYKKGNGAQLCCKDISKGSVHSARLAIFREESVDSGIYLVDANSPCVILFLEALGVRLDGPDVDIKRGVDAVKIRLSEDRWARISVKNRR